MKRYCLLILAVIGVGGLAQVSDGDDVKARITKQDETGTLLEDCLKLWNEKRECDLHRIRSVCKKIDDEMSLDEKIAGYRKLLDGIFSIRFEDETFFPLVIWGTEPFFIDSNDPKNHLQDLHRIIVEVAAEVYAGLSRAEASWEVRFEPIFRLAEKVDAEKFRLKALDVGSSREVIDMAERDLYSLLAKDRSCESSIRLLNRFESVFGRPIRSPEQIDDDDSVMKKIIHSRQLRMMKSFEEDGRGRHGKVWQKYWLEMKNGSPGAAQKIPKRLLPHET